MYRSFIRSSFYYLIWCGWYGAEYVLRQATCAVVAMHHISCLTKRKHKNKKRQI